MCIHSPFWMSAPEEADLFFHRKTKSVGDHPPRLVMLGSIQRAIVAPPPIAKPIKKGGGGVLNCASESSVFPYLCVFIHVYLYA